MNAVEQLRIIKERDRKMEIKAAVELIGGGVNVKGQ